MSGDRDANACNCERRPRADSAVTCTVHAPDLRPAQSNVRNHAECRSPRPERTPESVQAEQSYRDLSQVPPSQRPLASHRLTHAAALFETLRAFDVSKNRFADMVGVNEKQVRKWIEGLTPIQTTVIAAMPSDMGLDFLERLRALRGGGGRSGWQRELERLRKSRDLRAIQDAQRQLLDLAAELTSRTP